MSNIIYVLQEFDGDLKGWYIKGYTWSYTFAVDWVDAEITKSTRMWEPVKEMSISA